MNAPHKDYAGAKMGMWLFLFTEILLFGGLFLLYAAYLHKYPTDFHIGGKSLDLLMGGVNTVVLITSSLTVALSITALRLNETRKCQILLLVTIVLALTFLVNKFFEWSAKFHHGIYPASEHLKTLSQGSNIFYSLYFAMTGLHGIHVLVGGALLGWVTWKVRQAKVTAQDFVLLENAGLYWHIVDLVWIFLFPLFYLIA